MPARLLKHQLLPLLFLLPLPLPLPPPNLHQRHQFGDQILHEPGAYGVEILSSIAPTHCVKTLPEVRW